MFRIILSVSLFLHLSVQSQHYNIVREQRTECTMHLPVVELRPSRSIGTSFIGSAGQNKYLFNPRSPTKNETQESKQVKNLSQTSPIIYEPI